MNGPLRAAALACAALWGTVAEAQSTPCRLALALGIDVSASVDLREYRLQLDGLSAALSDPTVVSALLSTPSAPVQLLVYEWSGAGDQHLLLDWTPIRDGADLEIVRATLAQVRRREAAPGTALGPAMRSGLAHLDRAAGCWRRVLDISGDGTANSGIRPERVKPEFEAAEVTINALVIGADAPGSGDLRQAEISALSAYFRANVITGPDAFVQTALGYGDYAQSMTRKLKRELQGEVISSLSLWGAAHKDASPTGENSQGPLR